MITEPTSSIDVSTKKVNARPDRSQIAAPAGFAVAAVLLLLLLLASHWRTVDSSVLLFHLKAGEVISDSGQIPNRDIFSAGSRSGIWIYAEWLWAWVAAFVYRIGEWLALNALAVCLAALTYGLVLARARARNSGWFEASAVTLFIGAALLPVFQAEPTFAALPLFILSLLLMEGRRGWPMILFPPLVALWANLHSGVLLAFAVPFARLLFPTDGHSPVATKRSYLVVIMLAGLVATLITPHSTRLLPALLEIASSQIASAPVRLTEAFARASIIIPAALSALFAIVAIAGKALGRRDAIAAAIFAIASIALGTSAVYFLLLFLTGPAAAAASRLLAGTWATNRVRHLAAAAVLAGWFAWAAFVLFATRLTPDAWGTGIRPGVFPETAAGRLAAVPLRATILNQPEDAGYLTWRLWPNWKVAVDTRPGMYDREFLGRYEKIWQGGEGWKAYIALWRVNAVLGDTETAARYPSHNLYHELANSDNWTPVYWDRDAILYVKSNIELSATNLSPFRQLKPGLPWSAMEEQTQLPREWRDLAADIRRALLDDPGNPVAQEFLQRADDKL